jgi:peptidoglycan/xylan/chitin deacetylase (PgdA/CDA1 family)
VLAYHGIGTLPRAQDPSNLYVTAAAFTAQVRDLQRRGYGFLTLSELVARLRGNLPLDRLCALTFDDGSEDNATVLPPLLERLGVPATLYVCPGLLGVAHPHLHAASGVRLADGAQLAALAARDDVELGSHTNAHMLLGEAGYDQALEEMTSSKAALEAITGAPVRTFAYPGCVYSSACPSAARAAGYESAVTCGMVRGSWQPFELARVSIDSLENRLTWELKKRDLWKDVHGAGPVRAARALVRPFRHPRR